MGFDIVHFNLHKTFSQPHGGGGPGGGPIAVRDSLEPFLPGAGGRARRRALPLDYDRPKSIGKRARRSAARSASSCARTRYIRAYGPQLREMSEAAVLNANYLLARLREAYDLPYDRLCMHEFVVSARTLKREHGVTALDVAKRLIDYGFHPPTIYFPLVVAEALMIEPTETEAEGDARRVRRGDARRSRARRPTTRSALKRAPTNALVGRLDEVKAAKRVVVRYGFEEHPDLSDEPVGEPVVAEAPKGV